MKQTLFPGDRVRLKASGVRGTVIPTPSGRSNVSGQYWTWVVIDGQKTADVWRTPAFERVGSDEPVPEPRRKVQVWIDGRGSALTYSAPADIALGERVVALGGLLKGNVGTVTSLTSSWTGYLVKVERA